MTTTTHPRAESLYPALRRSSLRFSGTDGALEPDDIAQEMALFVLTKGDTIQHDGAAVRFAMRRGLDWIKYEGRRQNRLDHAAFDDDALGEDPLASSAFAEVEARIDAELALERAGLSDAQRRLVLNRLGRADAQPANQRGNSARTQRRTWSGALAAMRKVAA